MWTSPRYHKLTGNAPPAAHDRADMTVAQAAEYLGLPASTVYKLVGNRKLGACRHATGAGRGTIRIPAEEADR